MGDIDDLNKLIQHAKLLMTIDTQANGRPEEKSAAVQGTNCNVHVSTHNVDVEQMAL